jgi:hypothetical protein
MSPQIKNGAAFDLSISAFTGAKRHIRSQLLNDSNNRRNRMFNTSNTGKGFLPAMTHIDA